ncbi:MAG: hypothetical protein ACTSU7_00085 [Candidatus Heimdallarchaeaceae archaeon]
MSKEEVIAGYRMENHKHLKNMKKIRTKLDEINDLLKECGV